MFNKIGVSPVVATALLLVVAVVSVVGFSGWFSEFSSSVFVDAEKDSSNSNSLRVEGIYGDKLYLKSNDLKNINSVKIYDEDNLLICELNDYTFTNFNNSSLFAHWSFDNYNSTGIFDDSGNGYFGEFTGGISSNDLVSGVFGQGLEFDGFNDYLDITNSEYLNLSSDFSIEFWIVDKKKTNTKRIYFYLGDSSLGDNTTVDLGNKVLSLNVSGGSGLAHTERFEGLEGSYYIYDNSRILSNPSNLDTHRIEIWDITTNGIVVNYTMNSDCYSNSISYESYSKMSCIINVTKYGNSVFFSQKNHIYETRIYYLGNVDINLNSLSFDSFHRTPFSYGEQNLMFPYNGDGLRVITNLSTRYSYFESPYLKEEGNFHIMLVYENSNNLISLYRNGIMIYNISNNEILEISESIEVIIGTQDYSSNFDNKYFKGILDEIKIWDKIFNSTDVLNTYNNYLNLNLKNSENLDFVNLGACSLNINEKYNVVVLDERGVFEEFIIKK